MQEKVNVHIISPTKEVLNQQVDMVTVPGSEGVFSVLSGHMKLVASTMPGVVEVTDGSNVERYFVSYGVTQVDSNNCNILVDQSYTKSELNDINISQKIEKIKDTIDSVESSVIRKNMNKELLFLEFLKEQ